MTDEQRPNGVPQWLYESLRDIKGDIKGLRDDVHRRIDTVETDTHKRITIIEASLNQTRETVAGLNVKAGVWGSLGGALVSIGAAIAALVMMLKGAK